MLSAAAAAPPILLTHLRLHCLLPHRRRCLQLVLLLSH
jgi:hypothetical protein